ncbi:MAG: hypothetical protein EPO07_15050 [Verrucomicrobia bacterium]|nr:MAG: hypothetical protein EPO07_15050 [Verrucomicrobiota bacterium]
MKRIYYMLVAAGAAMVLGAGCSTYKNQSQSMTSAWVGGRPDIAAKEFGDKADKEGESKDSVVWHLEAGAAYRAAGNYSNSLTHLDAAQVQIEKYEERAKVKVANEAGAIMSNQQNLPYEGKSYDKIMLHTYKALNYLALGDADKARPEIIRAYQRQQDAVDENARRIEKAREMEAQSKEKDKVEKAKADPKFSGALDGVNKDLEGFKFYADYVNPFTVYLDGLFFLYQGTGGSDLEHAVKSLNRVIEVAGDNKFVQADLAAATNAVAGQSPGACTYVIFETGQAASLDQIRIDIPIIITKVSYVGAAFPKLARHYGEAPSLAVKAGDVQETTAPLASMDAIVGLDFKNEFPVIVTKTVVSTVAKAVATYAINEAASRSDAWVGLLTKVATAAAGAAMNIADTRTWTTLPKEFQVAKIVTPADRKLTLSAGSSAPVEVTLLDGEVNVVYAKSVTATTPLLVSQFKLK